MIYTKNENVFSNKLKFYCVVILAILLFSSTYCRKRKRKYKHRATTTKYATNVLCMQVDNTLKALHKSCFLRPDTGPCRADIIQWYYDVKQQRCYRFFWGGCQGNGNRFETQGECKAYCTLNITAPKTSIPRYCSLAFEYGSCFGYFYRWGWDKISKTCKRYMYSGCGGNQNNFQTRDECISNCLNPPNNTLQRERFTTCIPLDLINV